MLKVFLFFTIIFLLDFSIGSLLKYLYFHQNSGWLYRSSYAIDSTNAEIVIFGSSTANHHYNPNVFEKRMDMSTFNAGKDGQSLFYHYAILKGMLKRYSPRIVILDFDIGEFEKDQRSYDRISSLLPYYENHPEIRSIILLKSPYEKYKLISKIYPFNSVIFTSAIRNVNLNKNKKRDNDAESGYVPIKRVWSQGIAYINAPASRELDSNKINIFKDFIRECTAPGVKLYIVISPSLIEYKYENPSVNLAKDIANDFNVPFYNFSKLFMNYPKLFADNLHLNDSGAQVFSNKVIDTILKNDSNVIINNKYSNSAITGKK
ncbi:MAG TPA: hypothetical protein VIJ75_17555 [Hanamia sp.]